MRKPKKKNAWTTENIAKLATIERSKKIFLFVGSFRTFFSRGGEWQGEKVHFFDRDGTYSGSLVAWRSRLPKPGCQKRRITTDGAQIAVDPRIEKPN